MPERNIPRHCVILTALFVAATLAGFYAPMQGRLALFGTLKDFFKPFFMLPPWKMFLAILLNNSVISFVVLLSGILFGLVPLLAVAINGYILGVTYPLASEKVGYFMAATEVLPHGMLEIPAMILAAAYGLWLGVTFARRIRQRDLAGFGKQVRHAIKMFFLVAFPLFIVAAFVETFLIFSLGVSALR
jgi:stage II sporulation protein M